MTVTYIGESPADAEGTNDYGIRRYTRGFWLSSNSRSDGPYAVGSNGSLPLIGSVHNEDASAWCRRLSVKRAGGWRLWKVIAEYSSEFEMSTTATSDPAIITWSTEQFQKVAEFDTSGYAITNSAGDYFDPPAMIDDSRRIVTVQKNLAAVPSWLLTYQDAVNNDTFSVGGVSIAIGQAKMQAITVSQELIRGATTFFNVTFTMHIQKNGWKLSILDAGFRRKDSLGKMHKITSDGDDTTPGQPVLLDGAGDVLDNPTSATAVFREFTVYETKAFSSLPLT